MEAKEGRDSGSSPSKGNRDPLAAIARDRTRRGISSPSRDKFGERVGKVIGRGGGSVGKVSSDLGRRGRKEGRAGN